MTTKKVGNSENIALGERQVTREKLTILIRPR